MLWGSGGCGGSGTIVLADKGAGIAHVIGKKLGCKLVTTTLGIFVHRSGRDEDILIRDLCLFLNKGLEKVEAVNDGAQCGSGILCKEGGETG